MLAMTTLELSVPAFYERRRESLQAAKEEDQGDGNLLDSLQL